MKGLYNTVIYKGKEILCDQKSFCIDETLMCGYGVLGRKWNANY